MGIATRGLIRLDLWPGVSMVLRCHIECYSPTTAPGHWLHTFLSVHEGGQLPRFLRQGHGGEDNVQHEAGVYASQIYIGVYPSPTEKGISLSSDDRNSIDVLTKSLRSAQNNLPLIFQ